MSEALIDDLSQKIWDYHHLNHKLEKSDVILALGSNDLRVAEYAADLYLQGWAPLLALSGNAGALTRERFNKTWLLTSWSAICSGSGSIRDAVFRSSRRFPTTSGGLLRPWSSWDMTGI
jgi:hypothetical protein